MMTTVNVLVSRNKVKHFHWERFEHNKNSQIDIAAYPHSVNALNPGTDDDVRTPDKLIDGENDDVNGSHSWIAPILPNIVWNLTQISLLVFFLAC